jgi:hypothetical protein
MLFEPLIRRGTGKDVPHTEKAVGTAIRRKEKTDAVILNHRAENHCIPTN